MKGLSVSVLGSAGGPEAKRAKGLGGKQGGKEEKSHWTPQIQRSKYVSPFALCNTRWSL